MASVYIIHSEKTNKFYIGFTTEDVTQRVERHNNDYYEDKFTASGKPWRFFLEIKCTSLKQARQIENHIKKMKSKKYIQNLIKYPLIIEKLLEKYNTC